MLDIELAINSESFYLKFKNLKEKYSDIFERNLPKLNKDIDYITFLYEKNELNDINLIFIYYFIQIILKNENILQNEMLLKSIFKKAKEEMQQLDLNNKITIDEKIKILPNLLLIFKDAETIEDLNSLNIRNLIISERKTNSIIDKVCKFYDNFIENLTEDSKIFFSILQLNSGIGYYKKNKVYTFDLNNINMVKKYLKSLFPKSLTIFNNFKSKSTGRAFYNDLTGGIALNEIFLVPKNYYKIDYNSNNLNISEKDSNNIAMKIVLYIFHELGHKKFSHSEEEGKVSPRKIVRNNRLIELKYENHFLELCFNKFNNKNIFKLLISLKNKDKIIKRPDLFVDSLEKLENYVILKTIAEEKEISFQFDDESIEDEIAEMKKKINIKNYLEENEEKEKKVEEKKKKSHKKGKKYDSPNKKEYSFNYIIKFTSEEKEQENEENDEWEENEEEEDSEEDSEEKEETEEQKKLKRVLQKLGIKNDEELSLNIEKKLNEKGLSQDDYNILYDLYLKFLVKY